MKDSTPEARSLARLCQLCQLTSPVLLIALWPIGLRLAKRINAFRHGPRTPEATFAFETDLQRLLLEMGRRIMEWTLNSLEPCEAPYLPSWMVYERDAYRRKRKSPMRNLNCLFGKISVRRWLYESHDGVGLSALFPLELQLGIVAGVATPALGDRVARLAVDLTQRQLLLVLREQHQVCWGVETLRKVVSAMAEGLSPYRRQAQVRQILDWLQQAADQVGPRRILLAVGRDGIMLPIRGAKTYKEGATATISVYNRWGKRLGTVYLGEMPQELQTSLSTELTHLLEDVLGEWKGPHLRLAFITDAGFHPTDYYEKVLCHMPDPWCPGKCLQWDYVIDYYHACQYVSELAQAIFGPGQAAFAWAAKQRRILKEKPGGVFRVLRSAGQLRTIRGLVGQESDYSSAYNYLRRHAAQMNYSQRRRLRVPIGSGVTEAACKIVFTQRFKCAGMKWDLDRDQPILALRVIALSGVWSSARNMMFESKRVALPRTAEEFRKEYQTISL
jgi:hypothetical protein